MFILTVDAFLFLMLLLGVFGPKMYSVFLKKCLQPTLLKAKNKKTLKTVSVIIPVHDSAEPLLSKIEKMNLPQPSIIEVIIACDGRVRELQKLEHFAPFVRILRFPRCGKNSTLNKAVSMANGEIIIISDRDAHILASGLQASINLLATSTVAGCCGMLRIVNDNRLGQNNHWKIENSIKEVESNILANLTAANGSALAILKESWVHIPDGMADDLFIALQLKKAGKPFVFLPEFIAETPPRSKSVMDTFKRQKRITSQSFTTLWYHRDLFSPKYTHFAIMLMLHKVVRRMVPFVFLAIASFSAVTSQYSFFQLLLAQFCFVIFSLCGASIILHKFKLNVFYLNSKIAWFASIQLGIIVGVFSFLKNKKTIIW